MSHPDDVEVQDAESQHPESHYPSIIHQEAMPHQSQIGDQMPVLLSHFNDISMQDALGSSHEGPEPAGLDETDAGEKPAEGHEDTSKPKRTWTPEDKESLVQSVISHHGSLEKPGPGKKKKYGIVHGWDLIYSDMKKKGYEDLATNLQYVKPTFHFFVLPVC